MNDLQLLDLVDDEYNTTDDLKTLPTPGHTPGHTSILVSSQGERAYILGDVAHTLAQAHYTDWNPIFDIQPDISRKTRHDVLDMLEREGIIVSAGHFPDPGFERFVRVEGRRWWQAIKEGEDFFGKSVILSARIASQADGEQILVSSLLKALVESSGEFAFGDAKDVELKGLAGSHQVFGVRWADRT